MNDGHDPRGLDLDTRFERLWHWTQAAAILVMLVSGFAVHGSFGDGIDFGLAATVHVYAAVVLMVIWIFAIFWHLTTGQWRHDIPTLEKLGRINRYYLIGIFKGEKHPAQKSPMRKHNALQRPLYLVMQAVVSPIIWIFGLLYLSFNYWHVVAATGGRWRRWRWCTWRRRSPSPSSSAATSVWCSRPSRSGPTCGRW